MLYHPRGFSDALAHHRQYKTEHFFTQKGVLKIGHSSMKNQ